MRSSDMLFVVPADNDGIELNYNNKIYPACFDLSNIITICDMRCDGKLSYTSNYGMEYVDIAAPGTDIIGIYDKDYLVSMSGTSPATAIAVAEVVLIRNSENYELSAEALIGKMGNSISGTKSLSGVCRYSGCFDYREYFGK